MKFINNILASQANIITRYTNTKRKLMKTVANIHFNKTCRHNNLTPKYINIKTRSRNQAAVSAISKAKKLWINNEIKFLYKKKEHLTQMTYELHLHAAKVFRDQWTHIHDEIQNKLQHEIDRKYLNMNKKIEQLERDRITQTNINTSTNKHNNIQHNNPSTNITFYPRILNLSDIHINDTEKTLLEKGYKHSFEMNDRKKIESIVIDTETALANIPIEKQRDLKKQIASTIKNTYMEETRTHNNTQTQNFRALKDLNTKLKNNDVVHTRADKGNSIVLINNKDYINKTLEFITDNNIIEIDKDPTDKFQQKIKTITKQSDLILTESQMKFSINMNPKTPTLRSQIKTHKINNPIRPIVNFTSAPSYKLARIMSNILKDKLVLPNKYIIKNSIELANKIKNVELTKNDILISLDIKNLYTNIPIKETIDTMYNILLKNNENQLIVEQITNVISDILKQNYFTFNNKIYLQKDGLAMGSPLSAIMSEIFLQNIEKSNIPEILTKHNIKTYFRYVDDTFLICNKHKTEELLQDFNNIHNKLTYTMEKENNGTINFLDLNISRQQKKLNFAIYRKPTYTDTIINQNSNHPYKQKLAALNSMVFRMVNLPLGPEAYNREYKVITQIAINNGYNIQTIDKIINKQTKKAKNKTNFHSQLSPIEKKSKKDNFATFTYTDKKIHKITKILERNNFQIAYRTTNHIRDRLYNTNNNQIDKFDNNGVYKLECVDCNKIYVGQTGRKFKTRFKEHKIDFKHKKLKSAYAKHLINEKHRFESIENSLSIAHIAKKSNKLNTLESLEIYKNKDRILNDNPIEYNPLFELAL